MDQIDCESVVQRFLKGAVNEVTRAQARWLRENCERAGLSRGLLAAELRADEKTVERWMKGSQPIKPINLERLQLVLRKYLRSRNLGEESIAELELSRYSPSLEQRAIRGFAEALNTKALSILTKKDKEKIYILIFVFSNPTWADDFRSVGKQVDISQALRDTAKKLGGISYYNTYDAIKILINEMGEHWTNVMQCIDAASIGI